MKGMAHQILDRPLKVLFVCLLFFGISVILNGSLWELFRLKSQKVSMEKQRTVLTSEIKALEVDLGNVQKPSFIEKMALEKLEYVGENDLVFVFPGDSSPSSSTNLNWTF